MRKHVVLGTLLALGAAAPVFAAEDFSYSLVEVGYVSNEIDGLGLDGSGIALSGSFEFADSMFAFANVTQADYDHGSDLTTRAFSLGMGYAWPLGMSVDLVSGVSYEHLRLEYDQPGNTNSIIASERGIGLNVGVRGSVAENFELAGNVKYTDLGHGLNDFTLGVGGRYYFSPAFAAGIDVTDNDDGTAWTIALRYDFGVR